MKQKALFDVRISVRLAIGLTIGALIGMGAAQLYYAGFLGSKPETIQPIGAKIGGPFALTDSKGATVRDTDFRGRMMLIYFGYTYCPDVCPTDLAEMAAALDALGDKAERIVPIFITVDPERDTPDVMGSYTALFDPRIIGLTGSVAAIDAVRKLFGVYAAKVDERGPADYLVDHTAWTYLMDDDGSFILPLRHGTPGPEMAEIVRRNMKKR